VNYGKEKERYKKKKIAPKILAIMDDKKIMSDYIYMHKYKHKYEYKYKNNNT